MQLPPAFCLPSTELIARAIELAYDRDFSHIPYVTDHHLIFITPETSRSFRSIAPHATKSNQIKPKKQHVTNSVLGKRRNLLGYIEVTTLKRKWEANEVNPVSAAVQLYYRFFKSGKHGDSQSNLLAALFCFLCGTCRQTRFLRA